MENEQDLGYFSRFVADELGISRDTLRSWSLKLESKGIVFDRNPRGDRIYYQKDIRALKHMHELLGLQQPMNNVISTVSEKMEKDEYSKVPERENEEKTLSVFENENALVTDGKRLDEFKNKIILELKDAMREDLKEVIQEVMAEERKLMATEVMKQIISQLPQTQIKNITQEDDTPALENQDEIKRKLLAQEVAAEVIEKMNQERNNNEERSGLKKEVVKQDKKRSFLEIFRRFKKN